jgi:1,4-alpha-glucan branching enzyme
VVVCCNFTPVPRPGYRLGVPRGGHYDEIFNSDSAWYGGSDVGNGGGVMATAEPHHGRDHSIDLVVPPLATLVFKPRRG